MVRTLAAALLCALAIEAAAAGLTLGPEFPIGAAAIGGWPEWAGRPSFATDGDEIFIAFSGGPPNYYHSVYAVRLDRHGRLLTPVPLLLHSRAELLVSPNAAVRAVWTGGHYSVFFPGPQGKLHVVRVTRDGEVLGRDPVPAAPSSSWFAVATDGEEIVVATGGTVLVASDPATTAVLDSGTVPFASDLAFGGGRYAIVTVERLRVVTQFLERGKLTPPMKIASAGVDRAAVDVAWDGSAFVAAWSECMEGDCVVWTARLAADGSAAGPPRAVARQRSPSMQGVSIVPLGAGMVFITFERSADGKGWGRRFRDGVPVDAAPVALGVEPVSAFLTAHGALVTADGAIRVSLTESPATAALPPELPLTSMARSTSNEEVMAAAASPTAIAILRTDWRTRFRRDGSAVIAVMTRGGQLRHEIQTEAWHGALASDGRDLFALLVDNEYKLMFSRVEPGAPRVRIPAGDYPSEVSLVWTGDGFLAAWEDRTGLRLQRISGEGTLIGEPRTFPGDVPATSPRLTAQGGRLRLTWLYDNGWWMARLAADGTFLGAAERLPDGTFQGPASNGAMDAWMVQSGAGELRLTRRADGGAFVTGPPLITWNAQRGDHVSRVVLARAGSHYIAVYERRFLGGATTHAALIDGEGALVEEVLLSPGASPDHRSAVLLPLGDGSVLAVYTRTDDAAPYRGTWRTFARLLWTTPPPRRRSVR